MVKTQEERKSAIAKAGELVKDAKKFRTRIMNLEEQVEGSESTIEELEVEVEGLKEQVAHLQERLDSMISTFGLGPKTKDRPIPRAFEQGLVRFWLH